jgi:hypothetical protein
MSDSEMEFSGDEEPITWQSAKRFKLLFGKHRGKSLGSIVRTMKGREYLRYILNWSELRPETGDQIKCVLAYSYTLKQNRPYIKKSLDIRVSGRGRSKF